MAGSANGPNGNEPPGLVPPLLSDDCLDPIPSASEQLRIVKSLDSRTQLEVGIDAYIIWTTWFKSWKSYVGYDGSQPSNRPCGPIDNSRLMEDGQFNWWLNREGLEF
jgi:hypothetical protein